MDGHGAGEAGPKRAVYSFKDDAEILSRLLHDGRASLSVLAKDMGRDSYRQKAWRRLKELEAGPIWGYTAIVDERHVGWTEYLVFGQIHRLTPESLAALRKQVRGLLRDVDVRLLSLQATAEPDMNWIGRIAARSALAARRVVKLVQEAAPDAFEGELRVVEVVGSVAKEGKFNPDGDFLAHLFSEWMR